MSTLLGIFALNSRCVRWRDFFPVFAAWCVALVGAVGAASALAGGGSSAQPAIAVTDAWVRAVPPVAKNSAGYLVIENTGGDDVLIGASVNVARVTEMHEMVRSGDALTMRRKVSIPVAAGSRVVLAPGGLHLMLIGLQRPLQSGETLQGVLRFGKSGEVKVQLEVRQ